MNAVIKWNKRKWLLKIVYVEGVNDSSLVRVLKYQQRTVFLFKVATECDSTVCQNQQFFLLCPMGSGIRIQLHETR